MLIQVKYGYKQTQIYNINCQVAPLLDLIQKKAQHDVLSLLNTKQNMFTKQTEQISANIERLQAKLYKLQHPQVQQEKQAQRGNRSRRQPPKQSPKPTPEPPIQQEPPRMDSSLEKKSPKREERKGKKAPTQQVKELTAEQIKAQKLENLKEQTRTQIENFNTRIEKINQKLSMLRSSRGNFTNVSQIDLQDLTGARKFLRTKAEQVASAYLNTKTTYQLLIVNQTQAIPYQIDGFCVRTIEQDLIVLEEPDPKAKGKKPPAKKK